MACLGSRWNDSAASVCASEGCKEQIKVKAKQQKVIASSHIFPSHARSPPSPEYVVPALSPPARTEGCVYRLWFPAGTLFEQGWARAIYPATVRSTSQMWWYTHTCLWRRRIPSCRAHRQECLCHRPTLIRFLPRSERPPDGLGINSGARISGARGAPPWPNTVRP